MDSDQCRLGIDDDDQRRLGIVDDGIDGSVLVVNVISDSNNCNCCVTVSSVIVFKIAMMIYT